MEGFFCAFCFGVLIGDINITIEVILFKKVAMPKERAVFVSRLPVVLLGSLFFAGTKHRATQKALNNSSL